MRKKFKLLALFTAFICTFCICSAVSVERPVSQLIIFGDSLSDIGNFPENYYSGKSGECATVTSTLDNLTSNFYVPVSNPVFTGTQGYEVPMDKIFNDYKEIFKLSDLKEFDQYLPKQPPIDQFNRERRSYLWPHFLMAYLVDNEMIDTRGACLWPWTDWMGWGLDSGTRDFVSLKTASVDYAWSGALSGNHFHFPGGKIYSSGSLQEMKKRWLAYRNNRKKYELEKELVIPGLLKQVDIFMQDIKAKRLEVGDRTVYTLWSGGNDLFTAFNSLQKGNYQNSPVKALTYKTVMYNFKAIYRLVNEAKAQRVYVFNLFNVNMTPRINSDPAYNKFYVKLVINTLTALYNQEMQIAAGLINTFVCDGRQVVKVVDVNKLFAAMAEGKKITNMPAYNGDYSFLKFTSTYGQAGQLSDGGAYFRPEASRENNSKYMFWNAIHPGMQVENIIGYVMKKSIVSSLAQPAEPKQVAWRTLLNKFKKATRSLTM
ncbi:MAG: hypothetical protein GY750_01135 [Lentisphaerae bacterium]|nr:hypothetical protein [Lentisphaerota bacterium]MCP4100022.1 hypothetical protein [Lentisphaerota bacterium]